MDEITKLAWAIFRSAFKDGDDVVVETSNGKFHWGTLTAENARVVLVRPSGLRHVLRWEDVEFMAHDGFPVSKIMGMSPEEAERRATQTSREVIEDALLNRGMKAHTEFDGYCEEGYVWDEEKDRPARVRYIGGGCPFVAGPCELIEVHFRGNVGPDFWEEDNPETLVFRAGDGAKMMSFDTDHLFLNVG